MKYLHEEILREVVGGDIRVQKGIVDIDNGPLASLFGRPIALVAPPQFQPPAFVGVNTPANV